MNINQWPKDERPREKLLHRGAAQLTDAELLAIFLRTGVAGKSAVDLARELINDFGSLRGLLSASREDFCRRRGLGPAKFTQLQAALELARRNFEEQLKMPHSFGGVMDTKKYLMSQLRHERHEVFAILLLDAKHRLIRYEPVFYGTIDAAPVYPRVLLQLALEYNAAAVILAHNHPSGVAEPSQADRLITKRIVEAMRLVDIRVLDHLVVGDNEVVSFAEYGLI